MRFSLKARTLVLVVFMICIACVGCNESDANTEDGSDTGSGSAGNDGTDGTDGTAVEDTDSSDTADVPDTDTLMISLAEKYEPFFTVGVAIEPRHLQTVQSIIDGQFNRITAENAMKPQTVQRTENSFTWSGADLLADYARTRGIPMTGHTLVWHNQTPAWFFDGLTPGDPDDIETLKERLKAHIDAVVARYYDVIDNWDVVNEAMSDNTAKPYRDAADGSRWYEYFGSEEYIYWAFLYAHDAMEAIEPGGSAGKLYYNDYNTNLKISNILNMLDWLENTRGIKIDGVGLQGHWRIDWPSVSDIESTIQAIVDAGYKVKISELDISLYNDYRSGSFDPEAEKEYTELASIQQAQRYKELFAMFRSRAADITSVTLWGVSDDATWLNSHPVSGRKDYPLLYDRNHDPKAAFHAIMDF